MIVNQSVDGVCEGQFADVNGEGAFFDMLNLKTTAAIAATAVLLAGCAGMELQKSEGLSPTGSEFSKNLYSGYLEQAKYEFTEGDYKDADSFAIRARNAAENKPGQPEDMSARKLPAEKTGELTEARARLMAVLAAGAADKAPIQAANAQVNFDCWMQEQEENRQPEHIQLCKTGFTQAMLGAEAAVKPKPMARAPAPVKAAPAPKRVLKKYVVYFDFDSAKLRPDSQKTIMEAIDEAKKLNAKSVFIGGHTDRAGPPTYNDKLSGVRADAVAKVVTDGGISARKLGLGAFGENINAVKTGPGVAEKRNRRVEIMISN
jgi:outer membrane protein OmpA-like peptidoglycan-associated protein